MADCHVCGTKVVPGDFYCTGCGVGRRMALAHVRMKSLRVGAAPVFPQDRRPATSVGEFARAGGGGVPAFKLRDSSRHTVSGR